MSTVRDLQMLQYRFAITGAPLGPRPPDPIATLVKAIKAVWLTTKSVFVKTPKFIARMATALRKHINDSAEMHNRMMSLQDERYQKNWYHIRGF